MATERIVECIPNISEGRRQDVLDAIVNAVVGVDGVRLLHRTSDHDHHRTVLTFAGAPEAVLEAAFAMIETASHLIDLEQHTGTHPRLGAVDVVPFVPIVGVTMADCVALAHALGRRVGEVLGLPVYLYEAAAQRPERRNLADVRRGEYEGLKRDIHTPERLPDYGKPVVGKAGAVIIGARPPLIAFNAFLNTSDVRIAKAIARAIRASSGGLVGVKALGMSVDGQAQVSMNLVDYTRTPLYRALELLKREAAHFGASIARCELIGLIPQDALIDVALWYLHLPPEAKGQILEQRLAEAFHAFGKVDEEDVDL
jgi:glutamate formiminotransferase